jgi:hypothetical protein
MFEGKLHNFMGRDGGEYVFVQSTRMTIITRHKQFRRPGVTVNNAIAIRFYDSVLIITPKEGAKETSKTELPVNFQQFGSMRGLSVIKKTNRNAQIRTGDGAIIVIGYRLRIMDNEGIVILSITVNLPGFYNGQVDGLCGRIGQPQELITKQSGERYAVKEEENLFKCQNKCPAYKTVRSDMNRCIAKFEGKAIQSGDKNVNLERTTFEVKELQVSSQQPGENDDAFCSRIFSGLRCGKVDSNYYVRACAEDCKVAGNCNKIAKQYMTSFQREVSQCIMKIEIQF